MEPPPLASAAVATEEIQRAANLFANVKDLRLRLTSIKEDVLEKYV
jgi:hypothetical protein